jgi:hypothetical protein
MDNRRALRTRKRLACTIECGDGRSTGLILDVSATGLFVQTGAKLDPGATVILEFEPPGSAETVRLSARVTRRKIVPVRLQSVAQAGVGVAVEDASEAYFSMIAAFQDVGGPAPAKSQPAAASRRPKLRTESFRPKTARPAPSPEEKKPALRRLRKRFKVEVHEIGGKGARIVEVEALNVAAAGRRALEEIGEGWTVAGCELA